MKINILFELIENGKSKRITHKKACNLLDSGEYYQSNEVHLGELRFLHSEETIYIYLEKMKDTDYY